MKSNNKLVVSILLTIFLHSYIYNTTLIRDSDYKIYDSLQSFLSKFYPTNFVNTSILIIDIDEKSLDYLGQWPWSRLIMTEFINHINKHHPTSIGLDILFPEYDKTSPNKIINFYNKFLAKDISFEGLPSNLLDNDKLFAEELKKTKIVLPVYLSSKTINNNECHLDIKNLKINDDSSINLISKDILCNIKEFQKSTYNIGFINSQSDDDGILRRIPLFIKYKDKTIPTFALANLMNIDTAKVNKDNISILNQKIKMSDNSNVLLKFNNTYSYKKISAIDIFSNKFNPDDIKGKFVLVGASAVGLHDHYKIAGGKNITGIEVHATLMDNILNNSIVYESKSFKLYNLFISFFISFFILLIIFKERYENFIFILSFIILLLFINIYLLIEKIYFSFGYFLVPFLIQFFIVNLYLIFLYYRNQQNFQRDLIKAHTSTIDSMTTMIENRDIETGAHIRRTKEYVKCISIYLFKKGIYKNLITKEYIDLIYRACSLHDIGKIAIPDYILTKPGKLTYEEYLIMQKHPKVGKDIIKNAMKEYGENKFLKMAYNIAYYHHEKWDGNGYPNAIKGEQIPLEARIMAISDVYDALVTKRYYKNPFDYEYSEKLIIESSGYHFDPILVDAFIQLKNDFRKIAEENKD